MKLETLLLFGVVCLVVVCGLLCEEAHSSPLPKHTKSLTLKDYPPAPNSGNQTCTIDAQCGIPAANCPQLRDKCASLTGSCDKSRCVCDGNQFGCPNCHVKSVLIRDPNDPTKFEYTTKMPMMDGSGRDVNLCSYPQGGAKCKADSDCWNNGGLCLGGTCVCPDGIMCGNCTIELNDVLYGLQCSMGTSGGGKCSTNADCSNHGTCLAPIPNQKGICQCNPLYVCSHCQHLITYVVKGTATCPPAS